jgi:hypothetical protein
MSRNVDIKPTSQEQCQRNNLSAEDMIPVDYKRRTIMRKFAVSSAALACCSVIPAKWTTPLLEFGTLPAHATTSAPTVKEIVKQIEDQLAAAQQPPPTETVATTAASSPYNKTERIDYSGDISIDKILRRKFASNKVGTQYGKSIKIVFSTGGVMNIPDTSKDVNVDMRGYRPGGSICPYHDAGEIPKMEVYAEPGNKAAYITVHYKG